MSSQIPMKRKRGKGRMIVGEMESAQVITTRTVYETKNDGTVAAKEIRVPLYPPTPVVPVTIDNLVGTSTFDHDPGDIPNIPSESHQPERPHTYQVLIIVLHN